jgi:catechol 2,3-dioxygenase-like lactoylglutathione lyase family enzyme
MKFTNVRLLVKDYKKCFDFYTQKLGFEPLWDVEECYGTFKVAIGIEGLAIFLSDYMAPVVGNADKEQPVGYREKSMISFEVENVDDTYQMLLSKGIDFINQPTDMPDWGMRTVHFRDPEENLIELYTPLQPQKQS